MITMMPANTWSMAENRRAFWISCPSPSCALMYSATVM